MSLVDHFTLMVFLLPALSDVILVLQFQSGFSLSCEVRNCRKGALAVAVFAASLRTRCPQLRADPIPDAGAEVNNPLLFMKLRAGERRARKRHDECVTPPGVIHRLLFSAGMRLAV